MPDSPSPHEKLAVWLGEQSHVPDDCAAFYPTTVGDLRALLAEPKPTPIPVIAIPISDALQQVEALLDAMETCHICQSTLLVYDGPTHCESGCSYDCDEHEEPACTPISTLHQQARRALPALAQQMVEGEQRRVFLIDLQRRLDAVAPLIEQQRDDLVRTREALAVAEENLESAAISLASYDQSYGGGGGESEALDIARSLGFDGGSNECVEWLLDRCKLRAARIAALSPTGTPGAEKGSTK